MSHARRAIRFFGTVHSGISHIRTQNWNPLTPEHIVKTLVFTSFTGFVAGYKVMDMAFQVEVGGVRRRLLFGGKERWSCFTHHFGRLFFDSQEDKQTAKLKDEYAERFGRRLTLHGGRAQSSAPPQKFGLFDA